MRRALILLMVVVGIILYWWPFSAPTPPTKTTESLNAPTTKPKAPPRRQITMQEIMALAP